MLSNSGLALDAGAGSLSNVAGTVTAVATADLRSTGLANISGLVAANGDLTIDAAQAHAGNATDNAGGVLRSSQGNFTLATGVLRNAGAQGVGSITAAGDLVIDAAGAIDNTGAAILADGQLSVSATGWLTNAGGLLQAVESLRLESNGLDNEGGTVAANGAVHVNAAMTDTGRL